MGTNCNLAWREMPDGDLERVWVIHPSHPIAEGRRRKVIGTNYW
jgi:trehalose utilization protein